MTSSKQKLYECLNIFNEQVAQYSNAYYDKIGLIKIISLESSKQKDFNNFIKELDKSHRLNKYASELVHKHIHDFADKVPYELLV